MLKTGLKAATAAAFIAGPAGAEMEEKLVTVVTSENPQTQLMSMVLTMQALQKGAEVRILLCGPGGDIALDEAPDTATAGQPPKDMSPQGLLKAAISNGATAEVCAIYLPGRGEGPEVLMDGVGVAQPPAMADALLDDGAAVWSF
ncbi:hypothetical protein [Rhodosalinus sp. FB01]|uniref:hypothetical protein n=1 Tax=Rhodosalinus sp. FB01 TaxID=3239194 RepID=UPI00352322D1